MRSLRDSAFLLPDVHCHRHAHVDVGRRPRWYHNHRRSAARYVAVCGLTRRVERRDSVAVLDVPGIVRYRVHILNHIRGNAPDLRKRAGLPEPPLDIETIFIV